MKYKDSTEILFSNIFKPPQAFRMVAKLNSYSINNIEQLVGALNPIILDISNTAAKNKGLNANYLNLKKTAKDPKGKMSRLRKLLNVSQKDAEVIYENISKIKLPYTASYLNSSVMSMGLKSKNVTYRSTFWRSAKFKRRGSSYVIPNYDRIGTIFNQGRRGTCVANAACSMVDYLCKDKTSRQFLYHQCKMVDGIKNHEGTYIETSFDVLTKRELRDVGIPTESKWKYIPEEKNTTHQGPPPERCFHTDRYLGKFTVHLRTGDIIKDIKSILSGSDIHFPSPVVVGLDLYESFNNLSSQRTGWITMPLPGEKIIGGHAMLVVGYYEDEKVFLVRNSWGSSWATNNKYGYQGHALIPYKYFKKYCDSGGTIFDISKEYMDIVENDRLYNRFAVKFRSNRRRATEKKSTPKRKKIFSKLFGSFIMLVGTVALIYFFQDDLFQFLKNVKIGKFSNYYHF